MLTLGQACDQMWVWKGMDSDAASIQVQELTKTDGFKT